MLSFPVVRGGVVKGTAVLVVSMPQSSQVAERSQHLKSIVVPSLSALGIL